MTPPASKQRPIRAVAISGPTGARHVAGARGPVAEAMTAIARERGVIIQRDADLAEALTALDPETASSDAAAALTAALLDRLYRMNHATKSAKEPQEQ